MKLIQKVQHQNAAQVMTKKVYTPNLPICLKEKKLPVKNIPISYI